MEEEICRKVYVKVGAEFATDGRCLPRWIGWEDGHCYVIDRVKSCQREASRKAGGIGLRYQIQIHGQDTSLFYEGQGRWFVEGKR